MAYVSDLLRRLPHMYLHVTRTCSVCGKRRAIVAEMKLPSGEHERLCADCCRAAYDAVFV
jgi:hypothetical protein